MASNEMPQPPYVLLFEEVVAGARPLTILVDDRGAVPLFDSEEKAGMFVASTDFGAGLESVGNEVDYVAINPPPAGEGPIKVRMGSLEELIEALQTGRQEQDLFGLGTDGSG